MTGTCHWNIPIRNFAVSIIRLCMQIAPKAFQEVGSDLRKLQAKEMQADDFIMRKWSYIKESSEKGLFNNYVFMSLK